MWRFKYMSKKYQNPIAKVETVTIPTWEYADLVSASTLTVVVEKLVNGLDEYKVRDVLKVLFDRKEEAE
jgi:hypothetical protein